MGASWKGLPKHQNNQNLITVAWDILQEYPPFHPSLQSGGFDVSNHDVNRSVPEIRNRRNLCF
jgi:hypothetical protein